MPAMEGSRWLYRRAVTAPMDRPQVVHLVRAQRHILSPRLAGALQKMLPLVCMEKTEATDSPAACIRHMKGKPSSLRL